jgi:hypothetical protein
LAHRDGRGPMRMTASQRIPREVAQGASACNDPLINKKKSMYLENLVVNEEKTGMHVDMKLNFPL